MATTTEKEFLDSWVISTKLFTKITDLGSTVDDLFSTIKFFKEIDSSLEKDDEAQTQMKKKEKEIMKRRKN